jgi:hypothetical protein
MGNRPMVIVSDFDLIKDLYKKYEASGRPIQKPFHEARFGSADGTQRGLLQSTGHNGFKAFMKEHQHCCTSVNSRHIYSLNVKDVSVYKLRVALL